MSEVPTHGVNTQEGQKAFPLIDSASSSTEDLVALQYSQKLKKVEGKWQTFLIICMGHHSFMEVIVVISALALALYWIFYFTSITKETKQREYEDEQRRIYSKKYQNSHPDKQKSFWDQPKPLPIASDIRKLVFQKTKGLCFYCLKDMNNSPWEVDHVWPRRYGGSEELVNLVPSCSSCNGF